MQLGTIWSLQMVPKMDPILPNACFATETSFFLVPLK